MTFIKTTLLAAVVLAAGVAPGMAQDMSPNGSFADKWGTTFTFNECGGSNLCGTLDVLKGDSATEENLAFVGQQVMQLQQTAPNTWKGDLAAGGMSAAATITQTGPDTIDVRGCRAGVFCQTITYTRI